MQALAVIELDDVSGDIAPGFCMIRVIPLPDALHLQVQEESFGDRVVPAVPLAAHAADEAVFGQ